jgi:hypothetical protein
MEEEDGSETSIPTASRARTTTLTVFEKELATIGSLRRFRKRGTMAFFGTSATLSW